MPNRELGKNELDKVLASREARKQDEHAARAVKWPGEENLKLLAEAVNKGNMFVLFTDNSKFSIRYESRYKAVFIKPTNGDFIPCGYIPYSKLKEISQ